MPDTNTSNAKHNRVAMSRGNFPYLFSVHKMLQNISINIYIAKL